MPNCKYIKKILPIASIVLSLIIGSFAHADVSGAANLDEGWRLWLDPEAVWQHDTLYLPEDVILTNLPVNPPTGGWEMLNGRAGIKVSLPATVEEYYFNKAPARTMTTASRSNIVAADGYYKGVSWWYRTFTPPALRPGERLVFYFPAARLRSEVYVNGKLVGYNVISEAPFTADATDAINPNRKNVLAVRITNPGGRLDWRDYVTMNWGKYTLPATHAFGGLAGGVEMQVRAPVNVSDLAVFNKPNPRSVHIQAEISSTGQAYDGPINFSIAQGSRVIFKQSQNIHVPPGGIIATSIDVSVPNARLWDIDQPNLYEAAATLPMLAHSDRNTSFGFRWLDAKGLGTDAKLYLNGRRIVPRSSISWGFWAPNGIFPDKAAVEREIAAMIALGLDSIQNHRHMPKAVVLDAFDSAGFLRYCEAGGGVFTFQGVRLEPPNTSVQAKYDSKPIELDFLNRYQLDKELAMIRAFRSYPCVTLWTLQNETHPDMDDPRMRYALERMREADPSRMLLLKSGVTPEKQVWSLPYSDNWLVDDGSGYSGWHDEHTAVDSPGVWTDAMYKSPVDFKYHTDDRNEIVVWGELATGASPDDHTAIVSWYKEHNQKGYDLTAHQAILAAYNQFLDDDHFRSAFPTAEDLFRQAAAKHYFSAAHLLENARMCDAVDYIVLSGWESTAIDDHSGLVDALRQLKADPGLLHQAAQPEVLVIRPRHYVIATGDTAVVDIHQINEQNLAGSWHLAVTASLAHHKPLFHADYPVELIGGETFGQLLKQDIRFKVDKPGLVTIHATLSQGGDRPLLERDEPLLVVDPQPRPLNADIACGGESDKLIAALKHQFNVNAVPFSPKLGKVATILLAMDTAKSGGWKPDLGDAIKRARRDGTRVVLLTSGGRDAEQVAAFLAAQGLVTYSGPVGSSGASWMGFWFFGRKHWLLSGLPSDCVLDWPYQITSGNGLMLSGPGVESVIGYGKDHDPNVGVAAAIINCGRGKIVFLALPGLVDSFINQAPDKFQPVTAKRLIFNALEP